MPQMVERLTEAQFQAQIVELAERLGWHWMHVSKGQLKDNRWLTNTLGPLGQGWPDLVLIRRSTIIFCELKSQRGQMTEVQRATLHVLRGVTQHVYTWRPSDFSQAVEVLSNA